MTMIDPNNQVHLNSNLTKNKGIIIEPSHVAVIKLILQD